jgi:hypothetical protein
MTTPAAPVKFFAVGTTKIVFCTSISNPSSPTRSELDAGIPLCKPDRDDVSAINGFTVSSNLIDAPSYGSRFTSRIPGRTEVSDSSITFYQDITGDDMRSVLARDTSGYVVIMWGGDVEDSKMDVFPVTVSSVGKSAPDNAAADLTVTFAITSLPAEDVSIPAKSSS